MKSKTTRSGSAAVLQLAGGSRKPAGRDRRRSGFTLNETLVTMVIGSAVLLLGTQLLHTLLRADRGLFRWGTAARQLAALESQFRDDLQQATSATWTEAPPDAADSGQLRLTFPGDERGESVVQYQVERGRLICQRERTGETTHRQVYWLPAGGRWLLTYNPQERIAEVRAWHRLREQSAGEPAAGPQSEFLIRAGLRGPALPGPGPGGVE
ncbi:MAG: type II secretion system protein J [Planctomycetaceae bacterium]